MQIQAVVSALATFIHSFRIEKTFNDDEIIIQGKI